MTAIAPTTTAFLPAAGDRRPGPECPDPVVRAASRHRWDDLTFLHWPFEPAVVQRLLPAGLAVETFAGRAWVGLVPFRMSYTVGPLPFLPWAGRFPETNVRTYVRGPDGRTGVWFLSLDAARLGAVLVARGYFRLPYFWSSMAVSTSVSPHGRLLIDYRSRRRWPGPAATSRAVVEVGERLAPAELHALDHWLTARWSLYRVHDGRVRSMAADHEAWPLHRARVLELDGSLLGAAGLVVPEDPPLVHWSPGVGVRVSARDRRQQRQ